jgi:TPP-dependent pyruvate/acetoin dehydrogenase alpha subunit
MSKPQVNDSRKFAAARPQKAGQVPLAKAAKHGILQVLNAKGEPKGKLPDPKLPLDDVVRMYEMMVLVRAIDERGWQLQRSGRVEFWIPSRGLEAVHVASTFALEPSDWIFLGYRHPGSMLLRGGSLTKLFAQFFGRYGEPLKGRRLPTLVGDRDLNIVPLTTQVGSYIPHAAGAAWAAKLKGDDTRFLVYFGEGSSSRGEFHSAMNFAGVHKPPIIFMCENNGWAVTTPTDLQTASATFAEKGDAYGVRNLRVDGNDPLAVYAVTKEARELAASEGPTLIEAVTYRTGFHTSSDNPDLYRGEDEVKAWEAWDPVMRTRLYLEGLGRWSEADDEALWQRCRDEIQKAVQTAEAMPLPPPESMFDDIFEEPIWPLDEQKASLLRDLEGEA